MQYTFRIVVVIAILTLTFCGISNAQIRTWLPTTSGDWSNDLNWSGSDRPDTVAESATLSGSTAYTVNFDLSTTFIDNLTLSNSNATLRFFGTLGNVSLDVANGFTNDGAIRIDSDNTLDARLGVTSGALTNNGTISFGGVSTSGATLRRLDANVVNNGSFNVDQTAQLSKINATFTNNGTVNVAAGRKLSFGTGAETFVQNAGTVNNLGSLEFNGDTLNFNGGSFAGNNIQLTNSTLNIGAAATGAGTFDIMGTSSLSGNVSANQVLNLTPTVQNNILTAQSDLVNDGVINLSSNNTLDTQLIRTGTITNNNTINFGGVSTSGATFRRITADQFINNGDVNIDQNAKFNQSGGVFTNNANVNIAAGKSLDFESANAAVFNQDAGVVSNLGSFTFVGDILNYNGGQFTGNNIDLRNSTLNIASGNTGAGVFDVSGATTLSGDIAATQTLNWKHAFGSNAAVTANADFTNHGTLNINSDATLDSQLNVNGTFTNNATVNFGGASASGATFRRINGDVVNNGTVNVDQSAQLIKSGGQFTNNGTVNVAVGKKLDFASATNGIFNQNGGTFNNDGTFEFNGDTLNYNGGTFAGNAIEMINSNLNIGAGSTGAGEFNLRGTSSLSGDVAANQTLNVLASTGNSTTTAATGFTNDGVINLDSDNTLDVQFQVLAGDLVNEGEISFGGASTSGATFRQLTANLDNRGVVVNRTNGASVEVGTAGADHINSGVIMNLDDQSTIEFLGGSFTNDASGTLAGLGVLDFTQTGLISDGTIAAGLSPGKLTFDGDVALGTSSLIEVELGGTTTGTFDELEFLDSLQLNGVFTVELIDGFENSISSADTFTFIRSALLNGQFAGIADGDRIADVDAFGTFAVNYLGNDVILSDFQLSAVPEPGTMSLLGIGLLLMCRRQRKARVVRSN